MFEVGVCKMQNDKLIEEPELLFSVNTLLAFLIAEKYYNSIHYAWFSPKFDLGNEQPASSNPRTICNHILRSIVTKDKHCEKLDRIRRRMLEGASIKLKEGVISTSQELEIRKVIECSETDLSYMMPIIFVGTWNRLKEHCETVPIEDTASKNSREYLSRALPREFFDIVKFDKILYDIDVFEKEESLK